MKAMLVIGEVTLPLGGAALVAVLNELIKMNADEKVSPAWDQVLATLAEHPDPAFRRMVCGATSVPLSVLTQLASDREISVIHALIEDSDDWDLLEAEDRKAQRLEHSTQILSFVPEYTVRRWLSWPCLQLQLALANNMGKFSAACEMLIADTLVKHPSYKVREVIANDGGISRDYHEILVGDEDPHVSAMAAQTLVFMADMMDSWDSDDSEDEDED
ncbi:MAG: hypothetical protein M0P11_08670 [Anaerolineaceae bacterium]|nr:hypothetical protein [Anaerolineaceae bacterium]MCK9505264.1 hypothetical protein [Porticoccaceae bacterium]